MIAESLARKGLAVTYATPAGHASAWTIMTNELPYVYQALERHGVAVHTTSLLTAFDGVTSRLENIFTRAPRDLDVRSVVIVGLRLPDDALYHELEARRSDWADAGVRCTPSIRGTSSPATWTRPGHAAICVTCQSPIAARDRPMSSESTGHVAPPRVALVTARAAIELDEDLPPLRDALANQGAQVAMPCWDDPTVDWSSFDVAVLRSTWDYAERVAEFLAWCDRCAAATTLLNSPEVVRWNVDKHYLLDLVGAGVPTVPTRFVEPGADAHRELAAFLTHEGDIDPGTAMPADRFAEFVVKPAIGAGSRDAARYRLADLIDARSHVQRLVTAGRSVMLQPYLEEVDVRGETALVYIGGVPSHAIRKGPLLRAGAGFVTGLFAPEVIAAREATPHEQEVAAAAYAALPFDRLLYARIDMVHDQRGQPVVLELELAEPSLFFAHAPGSADRFASELLHAVSAGQGRSDCDAG